MSDETQIHGLLIQYATAIDSRDWALFRACFTENCLLDYGVLGS